jgi:YVTN family beta-propeller protein
MDETTLRGLLAGALTEEPPMGPVTQYALRKGLRLRRLRRLLAAGGALATIVAVGLGLRIAGPAGGHSAPPALGPAEHAVYAVDESAGKVMRVAPDGSTLIRTGPLGPFTVGPRSLALSPDGKTLYTVSEKLAGGVVTPVNISAGTVGRRIKVGKDAVAIAVTPDGKTAYVANFYSGTITPIDLTRGVAEPPIRAGALPRAIVIAPDGRTAYVLNQVTHDSRRGSVTPVNIATGKPGRPILVGWNPVTMNLTPDGTTLLVAEVRTSSPREMGSVTPVDIATGTAGKPIPVAQPSPWGFTFTPDGRTAYLPNWESDTVTPISLATLTAGKPIKVGAGPWEVAVTPDGKTAYVLNHTDHGSWVTPVDTATGIPGTPITVPTNGWSIAMSPDGRSVYVGSFKRGKLTTISTSTNRVSRTVMLSQVGPVIVVAGP